MKTMIDSSVLKELVGLLSRQLNVRMTFFDHENREMDIPEARPHCSFCRKNRRKSPLFDGKCRACDRAHLEEARMSTRSLLYTCHAGLLEGIVPLWSRGKTYLGSLVFGQLLSPDAPGMPGSIPRADFKRLSDIVRLLEILGEHIVQHELIRIQRPPWTRAVSDYIETHYAEKITLAFLARRSCCSTSSLAHHFTLEFGLPLRQYLLQVRLKKARELLSEGQSVKATAAQTGFYDEFHFSKCFRKRFGHPPSEMKNC